MAKLWIIYPESSTPETGIGGRHHYLAKELVNLGHNVTVIAARSHHLLREDIDPFALPAEEMIEGYKFVRIDVPRYTHAHDKRRILAWFGFAAKLPGLRRRLPDTPDTILYSSPHPIGFLGAERLAKAFGARLVFEVRDIWPLTLIEIGRYSRHNPFIQFMNWIEGRAYAKADRVVSNLERAVEHMTSRGMDRRKFAWIPNGISLPEVENPEPVEEAFEAQIPSHGFLIVYIGSLGAANALEKFIEAAAKLQDMADIHVLVVGQGRARSELERRRDDLGLTNVHFLGPVAKRQVQSLLALCDACYIGWRDSSLYRWGIAANKLPEYLYSGKPILHSFGGEGDPVERFDTGLTVLPENSQAIAEGVRRLYAMPEDERRAMGENGRKAATEHYDYAKL
ncbi:MAG: glycosyltransferase family 4 protein, partial [Pseudomonadota bacterium]